MRKIVVLSQPPPFVQPFFESFSEGSDPGFTIDPTYAPVQIAGVGEPPSPFSFLESATTEEPTPEVVIRVDFENVEAEARFLERNGGRIYADPILEPLVDIGMSAVTSICPTGAVGTEADVVSQLNLGPLAAANCLGDGVRIAVVDTGVQHGYRNRIKVAGGFSPFPGVTPGSAVGGHGTMCAWDALIAAPNATILDYPLLQSNGSSFVAFLSDAITIYAELLRLLLLKPGPLVVTNSWGMYSSTYDAPVGHPQNYRANLKHPFNSLVQALANSGADVLFAAGNCGSGCPSSKCGITDRGPGVSILGANGHPDVTTVAAVTVNDDRLGYSSQGPALLANVKPEIGGFSHFTGSLVSPIDTGTSAACPVVAGVVAALRSKASAKTLSPADMRTKLCQAARQSGGGGFNHDIGFGIVDAGAAFALV